MKSIHNDKSNLIIFIDSANIYYTAMHLKLSSLFYKTQLIDLFVYETLLLNNKKINIFNNSEKIPSTQHSIIVYNFHNITNQFRFFLFSNLFNLNKNNNIFSISEIFTNANWLEREVSEMHGVFFYGKKDIRNLLLPYGDTSSPMLRSYPSVGTRELFYDSITDTIVQSPVTLQF
jgi:NADH:ubiquinone oxidoreductase subunit C